jgi:DnaK suppressor protein
MALANTGKNRSGSTGIRSKRLAYLRGKLLERRKNILFKLHRDATAPKEKPASGPGDEYDQANDSSDLEMQYGIVQIDAAHLEEVEAALKKIEDGTYGKCERCDSQIPAARLRIMPFASLCVKCKEVEERSRKRMALTYETSWARVDGGGVEEPVSSDGMVDALDKGE